MTLLIDAIGGEAGPSMTRREALTADLPVINYALLEWSFLDIAVAGDAGRRLSQRPGPIALDGPSRFGGLPAPQGDAFNETPGAE